MGVKFEFGDSAVMRCATCGAAGGFEEALPLVKQVNAFLAEHCCIELSAGPAQPPEPSPSPANRGPYRISPP